MGVVVGSAGETQPPRPVRPIITMEARLRRPIAMTDIRHDLSTAFIAGADSPLVANLGALWSTDAELARKIEAIDDDETYPVEASKSGAITVRVEVDGGRRLYLHSRHRPLEEAAQLIDPIETGSCVAFHVHGFGLGYHVERLFERAGEEAIICVLEPDLRLLRTAMGCRDLTRLIDSRRVMFFTEADTTALIRRLTSWSAMFTMGFTRIAHAASINARPAFHEAMGRCIDDFNSYCRTNINTLLLNGRRTAENIARNIGWYAASPGIGRLRGRHAGTPAVIVSAGPSLRKNKHLLKGIEDRAVLIAVQTTLKPLLEMGIEPHYVTSLDYHDICTRFFEGLPATLRTELVAEPKATDRIFDMHPGEVSLLGNAFAEALVGEMKLERPTLAAGATVAHLAYYLAEHLGCDPIIFVGQDLGFSDGLCYSPGTSYEAVWRPELGRFCTMEMKQWEQIVRDRPILRRIEDARGEAMYTEERLLTYLRQFEKDFAATKTTIIDATEGGAAKRGVVNMTLAEAIERHCGGEIKHAADHPGLEWGTLDRAAECIVRRKDEANRIAAISRRTLPLLEEIRDRIDNQGAVNRAIARLDALRGEMNDLGACYELVMQLSQETELGRFQSDRRISAGKADAALRQRLQVERDIDNVRGVIVAAGEFAALMDEVAGRLNTESVRRRIGRAA